MSINRTSRVLNKSSPGPTIKEMRTLSLIVSAAAMGSYRQLSAAKGAKTNILFHSNETSQQSPESRAARAAMASLVIGRFLDHRPRLRPEVWGVGVAYDSYRDARGP